MSFKKFINSLVNGTIGNVLTWIIVVIVVTGSFVFSITNKVKKLDHIVQYSFQNLESEIHKRHTLMHLLASPYLFFESKQLKSSLVQISKNDTLVNYINRYSHQSESIENSYADFYLVLVTQHQVNIEDKTVLAQLSQGMIPIQNQEVEYNAQVNYYNSYLDKPYVQRILNLFSIKAPHYPLFTVFESLDLE